MFFLKSGIFGPLFLYKNNILSAPFSFAFMGLPLCACWYFWWCFTISEVLFIFHQSFFFRLNNISWLISNSLILHFIYSNLLLISSREFFILLILIFNSVSIWLFFLSFVSLWYFLFGQMSILICSLVP